MITEIEEDFLRLVPKEYCSKEIAQKLSSSGQTIGSYRKYLKCQLDINYVKRLSLKFENRLLEVASKHKFG